MKNHFYDTRNKSSKVENHVSRMDRPMSRSGLRKAEEEEEQEEGD